MNVLDRKLARDLTRLSGQIVTICLVVASGICGFVAMQTAYRALIAAQDSYYADERLADVWGSAYRAPNEVAERIRALDGVSAVYPRVVEGVRIPLEHGARAASGALVSLPEAGAPPLNGVHIVEGRLPEPDRADEAVLLEHFAEVQGIAAGDQLDVVINGTLRRVTITGLGMSPEYVLAMGGDILSYTPGSFAVLWMRRPLVAAAFDMDGAFNNVAVRLRRGAVEEEVISAMDAILAPYGGSGAIGREHQPSARFVSSELQGLQVTVTVIPLIFLSVAAFLVNVVLTRLVELQRGQIATMKALGYPNGVVGRHYLKLVSVIVVLGALLGVVGGALLGKQLLGAYTPYFRFPHLDTEFNPSVVGLAVGISLLSAVAGGFFAVRRVTSMQPAEAMRPPAPPAYRTSTFDRVSALLVGGLGQMVFREMRRRPGRLLVSVLGISMAVMIVIIGRFASDSMANLLDTQFERAMREDITVAFFEPVGADVLSSLRAIDGVTYVEGMRNVPVTIHHAGRSRDTLIEGHTDGARLRRILNRDTQVVTLPMNGIVLSDILAERLGLEGGETVRVDVREGDRESVEVRVVGVVSDMLGMQGYMRRDALQALLGEAPTVTTVLLSVDSRHVADVERRLYTYPGVAGLARPDVIRRTFTDTQGGAMLAMSLVMAVFASVIAVGIVYNNARVTLSSRSRDLASMRVLGFTRAEISTILMGELAVQVAVALPIGMWLGVQASAAMMNSDPESFRMPPVVSIATYTYAAAVTCGAALFSGLLVRRKLDKLDLIAVLKTRE